MITVKDAKSRNRFDQLRHIRTGDTVVVTGPVKTWYHLPKDFRIPCGDGQRPVYITSANAHEWELVPPTKGTLLCQAAERVGLPMHKTGV